MGDKTKKKHDRHFIDCSDAGEISALKKKFFEKYKKGNVLTLTEMSEVTKAIEYCCDKIKGNNPRKEIEKCISIVLKIVN